MEITKYQNHEGLQEKAMKKKRSRGLHVIRVMLFMLRRRKSKPYKPGFWRKFVDSVGQMKKASADITIMPSSNITMLPLPEKKVREEEEEVMVAEFGDDVVEQLSETVEAFTSGASSSSSGMSAYGSAMSLRDMDYQDDYDDYDDDNHGGDDDEDVFYGAEGGDDMIDAKAEEFIAKFYAQIRMQNIAYTERCKAKEV